jgi:hypothetical protein
VDVARDAYVADEPDHAGPLELESLRVKDAVALLDHLGALLEDEYGGAAHRADVDRLVARVQNKDPSTGPVGLMRPPAVEATRHRDDLPVPVRLAYVRIRHHFHDRREF